MINIMKADVYRLLHSPIFYGYMLVMVLIEIIGFYVMTSVDLSFGSQYHAPTMAIGNFNEALSDIGNLPSRLTYFVFMIFIIIVCQEFSEQTLRNTLTGGTSKLTFVMAKYLTLLLAFTGTAFILCGLTIVMAVIKFGTDGVELSGTILSPLMMSVGSGFVTTIIYTLAMLILSMTRNLISAISFVLIYPTFVTMLSNYLGWSGLRYLNFSDFGSQLTHLNSVSLPYLIIAVLVIVVSLFASYRFLKIREL